MCVTPNSALMVSIVFNLGVLGDNLPINTHYIELIQGFPMTGYVGRGTSNYPLREWHANARHIGGEISSRPSSRSSQRDEDIMRAEGRGSSSCTPNGITDLANG